MKLTDLEREMLLAIHDDEYNNYGLDGRPWSWSVTGGTHAGAAVLGSLVRKGLVQTQDTGRDANCYYTEQGKAVTAELLAERESLKSAEIALKNTLGATDNPTTGGQSSTDTERSKTMTARTTTEALARRIQEELTAMKLESTIDVEGKGKSRSYKISAPKATQKQMDLAQDRATAEPPPASLLKKEEKAPATTPPTDEEMAAHQAKVDAALAQADAALAAAAAPTAPASATAAMAASRKPADVGSLSQLKDDLTTLAAALVAAGQQQAASFVDRAVACLGAPATDTDVMGILRLINDAGGELNFGKVNKYRSAWQAAKEQGLVIYWWPDRSKGAPAAATRLTDAGKAKLAAAGHLAPADAPAGRRQNRGRRATD